MSFLLVQLSDIHFRSKTNPVYSKIDQIVAAVASIVPRPQYCLVVVTGDIAWSGQLQEYEVAKLFFDELLQKLTDLFKARVEIVIVPGNHDCFVPTEDESLRKILIDGLNTTLQSARPDMAVLKQVLGAQENFEDFYAHYRTVPRTDEERIYEVRKFNFGDDEIAVMAFNTALLTQRREVPGSLSLPMPLLDRPASHDGKLIVAIYHHPDNWIEPEVRRTFRKFIETNAQIVLTGHEHQKDSRTVVADAGDQVIYVEADALQDLAYSKTSGFNCFVLDIKNSTCRRYQFRWKDTFYRPVIENATQFLDLYRQSSISFNNDKSFLKKISEEPFGFSHRRKPKLELSDVFVYPSLSLNSKKLGGSSISIRGDKVLKFVLKSKKLLFQGTALSGKTSLLKTLYRDLPKETDIVPILLNGEDLNSSDEQGFYSAIWHAFRQQYSTLQLDAYKQLRPERRALLIDNWHKCRLTDETKREILTSANAYFSMVLATSSELISLSEVYSLATGEANSSQLNSARLTEFSASGRGRIIDKWMRIALADAGEEQSLSRDIEREQSVLDYLIGKKTLPSLPYLILGVLQARQSQRQEVSDPGSFGYLVQKLVLDALSLTKGKRKLMDRKDSILRRVSFEMFVHKLESITIADFKDIVREYSRESRVTVEAEEVLEDLIYGQVLTEIDGNLSYTYHHFYFYFLARHFIDEIEGPRGDEIRQYLETMANRPLAKSNQQTLIFYLFFKKRDPIIDCLIAHANATFRSYDVSDMLSDTAFLQPNSDNLCLAAVSSSVDTDVEREKRLEAQDGIEAKTQEDEGSITTTVDFEYDESLAFHFRNQFASARLELLGQVIRNFPDSLDGDKKIEILDAAFRLGLRTLRATIVELEKVMLRGFEHVDDEETLTGEERKVAKKFIRDLVALFVRACCDSRLLAISRAVGVADLEKAYTEAIGNIGLMPSTELINLAIKLDHSDGFPFKEVKQLQKALIAENRLPLAVLTDLVVRHTQIFKHKPSTLRSIATLIKVDPLALMEKSGS